MNKKIYLPKCFVLLLLLTLTHCDYCLAQQSAENRSSIGLAGRVCYLVETLDSNSVARAGGLKTYDIVFRVNQEQFSSLEQFRTLIRKDNGGIFSILRRDGIRLGKSSLVLRKESLGSSSAVEKELGLNGSLGYLIEQVRPGGPASLAGFQVGDVILAVDGIPFSSIEEFLKLRKNDPGTKITLTMLRQDEGGVHRYNVTLSTVGQ